MKNIKALLFGTIISLTGFTAYSQSPSYPAASPAASVSRTFGLTKVEITYSSPGVKKGGMGPERQIWGGVVPYDSVWRTGANQCTNISFSTDVMVGGKKVKKGRYALFTIPGRNSWTIILNTDADQWGAYGYKKSLDTARFMVSPQMGDFKERMSFNIESSSDSAATVTLCWEKLKVSFDVMADTKGIVKKNIDDFTNADWRAYANAANYYADNNLDLKKAHAWSAMAISMKDNYTTEYIMAKILHAEGNDKDALKYATQAKAKGDDADKANDENYQNNYKAPIAKLLADVSTAAPAGKKK